MQISNQIIMKVIFSLHISKVHIEIDLLPKFQEKINEGSLLYRMPLIS